MKYSTVGSRDTAMVRKLCYLFLVFLAGCITGWVYEEVFYWVTEGMLRNRGILYGPWLPIYGVGALAIYAMKPLKSRPAMLFLLCVGATGIVEYVIGLVGIRCFGLRLWDYRGLFLNIGGIICFRSVISFGILGMVFHYLLEPLGEKLFARLSCNAAVAACTALAVVILLDCVASWLFRTPITY